MMNPKVKIFCDFDGTIAKNDIGNHFYRRFGNEQICDDLVKKWREGKISSNECLSGECSTINNLTLQKAYDFIDAEEIDSTFIQFVEYCNQKEIDLFVLSDGLDIYINRLFSKHNLDVKYYSNKLLLLEDGSAQMIFPFSDSTCLDCANCKRNHVISNSGDDEISIYIGDGKSDFCPIEYCDYIFAKGDLLLHCEKNRISFYPFSNFVDVITHLNNLLGKKRIRKRHQSLIKRKELYEMEA